MKRTGITAILIAALGPGLFSVGCRGEEQPPPVVESQREGPAKAGDPGEEAISSEDFESGETEWPKSEGESGSD